MAYVGIEYPIVGTAEAKNTSLPSFRLRVTDEENMYFTRLEIRSNATVFLQHILVQAAELLLDEAKLRNTDPKYINAQFQQDLIRMRLEGHLYYDHSLQRWNWEPVPTSP